MNRRDFFTRLSSGIFAASAPALFLPKLIKPAWKPTKPGLTDAMIENVYQRCSPGENVYAVYVQHYLEPRQFKECMIVGSPWECISRVTIRNSESQTLEEWIQVPGATGIISTVT